MPTLYKDQFFTIDPGSPPPGGTALNFTRNEFTDQDNNGQILNNSGDTWEGTAITSVWPGDTLTINVPGVGNITYTGVTFYLAGGLPAVFTPTDGQVLQNGTFVSSTFVTTNTQAPVTSFGPTCFTPGTLIRTPKGAYAIETLNIGDMVETMDDGAQPVRLIVRNSFRAVGNLAPIRFAKGAIGNNTALLVSPQHRMLITGWQAELFYAQEEVLVAAKHLVNDHNITCQEGGVIEYIHLLFDKHQIVFGAGVPSESYYPQHAVLAQDQDTMVEALTLFPELAAHASSECPTVRPLLRRTEAALLAA